jgi:hypothetical protein
MTKMVRKQVFITARQSRRLKAHAASAGVFEPELGALGYRSAIGEGREKPDWRSLAASFSDSWAQRENLYEEMREIRSRWNRRHQFLGRKAKRSC